MESRERRYFGRFMGDYNGVLTNVQRGTYWTLLPYLYRYSKDIYLRAVHYTNVETDLSRKIRDVEIFDDQILHSAYYKIAAYYRYRYPDKLGQLVLPFVAPDLDNLSLEEILDKIYEREWCSYWYEEVKSLAEEPIIVRTILTAIASEVYEDSIDAEDMLMELLHDRYGKSWDNRVHLLRESKKKSRDTMMIPPEPDKRLFR